MLHHPGGDHPTVRVRPFAAQGGACRCDEPNRVALGNDPGSDGTPSRRHDQRRQAACVESAPRARRGCCRAPEPASAEPGAHLAGDLEVLARCDHERACPSVGRTDLGVGRGVGVCLGVEREAEEPQPRRGTGPDLGRVLADAAGEDERVEAAQAAAIAAMPARRRWT